MDPKKVWIRDRVCHSKPRLASKSQQLRLKKHLFLISQLIKKYDHSFMKQQTDRGGKITNIVFVKEPQTPLKIIFLFMVKKRSDDKYEKIFKEIRAEAGLDSNSKICHKNLNNNHILFPFVASEMCSVIILNSSNVNNRLGEFGCFSL